MRNLGNTCFASAAVWALGACPRVRAAVAAGRSDLAGMLSTVMRDPRSAAWPGLVRAMDALIGRRGNEPHDSHELICALVDKLELDAWFNVNTVTGIKCGACGKAQAKRETNIYVSSEPAGSLAAGLTATHAPRWVEGRRCDACKRTCRAAVRSVPRTPAPDVLAVRAPPEGEGRGGLWIEHSFGYCGSRYRVRSVIVYRGDGRGGHYNCAVWSPSKAAWAVHDDDEVRGATITSVAGASLIRGAHTVLYERA